MARVTVEDCVDKVESPYELVLVAKERTTQLNSGVEPTVDRDNDKNTVIALREIGEGKISIKTVEDSAINKLRKVQSQPTELEELEVVTCGAGAEEELAIILTPYLMRVDHPDTAVNSSIHQASDSGIYPSFLHVDLLGLLDTATEKDQLKH